MEETVNEINKLDSDGAKIGYWEHRYDIGGGARSMGHYENNKKIGYWEVFWHNGEIFNKGHYKNGKRVGYWIFCSEDSEQKNKIFYGRNYE